MKRNLKESLAYNCKTDQSNGSQSEENYQKCFHPFGENISESVKTVNINFNIF